MQIVLNCLIYSELRRYGAKGWPPRRRPVGPQFGLDFAPIRAVGKFCQQQLHHSYSAESKSITERSTWNNASQYRRIDVSTYRRIDVSTYRRIDVSTYRRIDVSTEWG